MAYVASNLCTEKPIVCYSSESLEEVGFLEKSGALD